MRISCNKLRSFPTTLIMIANHDQTRSSQSLIASIVDLIMRLSANGDVRNESSPISVADIDSNSRKN